MDQNSTYDVIDLGTGNRQPADFRALYPNASNDGIDLLRRLLVIEPERRLTAHDALRHEFVNEFDEVVMEYDNDNFDFGFESEV
jgi:serine/threonine protein kinase